MDTRCENEDLQVDIEELTSMNQARDDKENHEKLSTHKTDKVEGMLKGHDQGDNIYNSLPQS